MSPGQSRTAFRDYLIAENKTGSNRASSHIRAIDLLDSILSRKAAATLGAESIWTISSAEQVHRLYQRILEQQRLGQDGIFAGEEPVSYFSQYENRCCVTGLDLPELCIASHIIRWTDNAKTRLDPRNGLCLSATYDKTYENHLITFDEYYVTLNQFVA